MKDIVTFLNEALEKEEEKINTPLISENKNYEKVYDLLKGAMVDGYIVFKEQNGKYVKYGVSEENWMNLFDQSVASSDELQNIYNKIEREGNSWKFKSLKDGKREMPNCKWDWK